MTPVIIGAMALAYVVAGYLISRVWLYRTLVKEIDEDDTPRTAAKKRKTASWDALIVLVFWPIGAVVYTIMSIHKLMSLSAPLTPQEKRLLREQREREIARLEEARDL